MSYFFAPLPRHIQRTAGTLQLTPGLLALNTSDPQKLFFAARQLRKAVRDQSGVELEIVAGNPAPARTRITLTIVTKGSLHPQGYVLTSDRRGVEIVASSPAGIFYGVQTLRQLLLQTKGTLPG